MENVPRNQDVFERMGALTLKGREVPSNEEGILWLEIQGGVLKIRRQDVLETSQDPTGQVIKIARDAKVIYETMLYPDEAESILSQRASIQLVQNTLTNRCVECSRCTGGECECSRCADVMRNRCVECSRCTGGECECSRCVDVIRNRCVECSRCTGGECECSRCVDVIRNRCVECSRCSGGECECSRCIDAGFGSVPSQPGVQFRRQLS